MIGLGLIDESTNKSWWYVKLPYATFALEIENDYIVKAPPIARWMLRRPIDFIGRWIEWKGGVYEKMGE